MVSRLIGMRSVPLVLLLVFANGCLEESSYRDKHGNKGTITLDAAIVDTGGSGIDYAVPQVLNGDKLSTCVPEFQPEGSLVSSITESIAWMDSNNLVPESHDGDLEDKIIASIEDLPSRLAKGASTLYG